MQITRAKIRADLHAYCSTEDEPEKAACLRLEMSLKASDFQLLNRLLNRCPGLQIAGICYPVQNSNRKEVRGNDSPDDPSFTASGSAPKKRPFPQRLVLFTPLFSLSYGRLQLYFAQFWHKERWHKSVYTCPLYAAKPAKIVGKRKLKKTTLC